MFFFCYYISYNNTQFWFPSFIYKSLPYEWVASTLRQFFGWFCLQISRDAKYFFLSCLRHCDRGLIVVIVYYFQIWNTTLLLLELLAVTWVPCILRHPILILVDSLAVTWVPCILGCPISNENRSQNIFKDTFYSSFLVHLTHMV